MAFVEQGAQYSKIGSFAGIIDRYDGQSIILTANTGTNLVSNFGLRVTGGWEWLLATITQPDRVNRG